MRVLKKSTPFHVMVFMTDSADHITGKAGLTLVITASKNGGAFSAALTQSPTGGYVVAVTDRGSGWYDLSFVTAGATDATSDTLGELAFHITASGADTVDFKMTVCEETLDDLKTVIDKLPTNYIAGAASPADLTIDVSGSLTTYGAAKTTDVTTSEGVITGAISALNDISAADVWSGMGIERATVLSYDFVNNIMLFTSTVKRFTSQKVSFICEHLSDDGRLTSHVGTMYDSGAGTNGISLRDAGYYGLFASGDVVFIFPDYQFSGMTVEGKTEFNDNMVDFDFTTESYLDGDLTILYNGVSALIGAPVDLGGGATIAANLADMASNDPTGAAYDPATDSLRQIASVETTLLSAIGDVDDPWAAPHPVT